MERTDSTPSPDKHRDDAPALPTLPRPSSVLAEPATVQACARDYASAADVRRTMGTQTRRAR